MVSARLSSATSPLKPHRHHRHLRHHISNKSPLSTHYSSFRPWTDERREWEWKMAVLANLFPSYKETNEVCTADSVGFLLLRFGKPNQPFIHKYLLSKHTTRLSVRLPPTISPSQSSLNEFIISDDGFLIF